MSTVASDRSPAEESAVAAAASAGDEAAFAALAERYRRELQLHCYRMLASFEDSEDLVQETFLRAWRKRDTFRGRSTFRAWLYRIATNACLDALDRRPRAAHHAGGQPLAEISWLQPYPDRLLDGVAPSDAEPEAEVVAKETIELAFIAAIQLLTPKQRAVLIGRDALVASWVEGGFGSEEYSGFRCVETRVNRQPAVACYLRRPAEAEHRPLALDVLRIEDGLIAEVVAFPLEPVLYGLGLPHTL